MPEHKRNSHSMHCMPVCILPLVLTVFLNADTSGQVALADKLPCLTCSHQQVALRDRVLENIARAHSEERGKPVPNNAQRN